MRRKILSLILFFFWPLSTLAWNAPDHQAMGRLSLSEVARGWGLLDPVPIRPLTSLLDKLGKIEESLGDFWHFSDFIKINPTVPWNQPLLEEGEGTITPLQILSLYSIDPDDGRDKNLIIRDAGGNPHYAFPDQFWFGAMSGGNSQAFRHLEKPPFSWKRRHSTFGFPFRAVGEATSRVEIYYHLARLAFALREEYWGWRFLASSFHYLQDLHNPYHAAQITPKLLGKGVRAYFSWGRKEKKGLLATLSHIVSNSHRFFETYLEKNPHREPLRSSDTLSVGSVHLLALQVRDESNRFFPDLSHAVGEITTSALTGPHLFNSDTPPYDDPLPYLNKEGPSYASAHEKMEKIVANRFAAAGQALRTEVWLLLQEKKSLSDPKTILQEMARLVALHPQKEP